MPDVRKTPNHPDTSTLRLKLDEEALPFFEQRAARLPRTPNYG